MKRVIKLSIVAAFIVFAMVLQTGCATHNPGLPESHAERLAIKAGMDDPKEVCEHGFRKVYFFVQTEGTVTEPFAHWDCLDRQSADEVTRLNELSMATDEVSAAEFNRLRKKYSAEGWTRKD